MKDANLQNMNAKELLALRERIDAILPSKQEGERHKIRDVLEQMARKHGFAAAELFSNGAGKRGRKIAPKYRNPKNNSETWTGRGRKPRWIVAAGGDPTPFLIK